MSSNKKNTFNWLFLPLLGVCTQASADYEIDVGYTQLQTELGIDAPDGADVKVTQVEASASSDPANPLFAPDPNAGPLIGKSFAHPGQSAAPTTYSPHATGVGMTFYGTGTSMAPAIDDIHSYEVNQWLNSLINSGPGKDTGKATITDRRIANHSWALFGALEDDSWILHAIDRQVDLNEYIQVGATGSQILGNTYNAINVGLTNTQNGSHSADVYLAPDVVDTDYPSGRAMTHLVAPAANLSTATPIVASATALLVQTGHEQTGLSNGSTTIQGAGTIYNAERSETIKAALMAGADRQTNNTSDYGDISDYRSADHQTANGLDTRYGAGQLNINNSYKIISAGEQNSFEDDASNLGEIDYTGFDYDPNFGGASGSNSTATYSFTAYASESIAASLVWNSSVSNDGQLNTTVHHLGLSLVDVTDDNAIIAKSESMLDNTQNIFWQDLIAGHEYQLLVSSLEGNSNTFNWDYSLAWNRSINGTPVPLPAAFWLFTSALASIIGFQRKPLNA